MSDPGIEEDDLVSQNDIDKMLSGDAPEDDGGELSQDDIDSLLNGPGPDADDADDEEEDAAELSQDDIDRMMSGDTGDDDDEPEDDGGELSQDDIDSLLNGPGPDDDDADDDDEEEEDAAELSQDDIDRMMSGDSGDDDDEPEDDGGELSQNDIDSLLNGPGPDDDDADDEEEDAAELSQDDIDRMMSGDDDDDDDELISLEDIQGAMDSNAPEPEPAPESEKASGPDPEPVPAAQAEPETFEPEPEKAADPEPEEPAVEKAPATAVSAPAGDDPLDEPIDEDQAEGPEDCMIVQETMDALIEAGLPEPEPEVPQADAQEPSDAPAPPAEAPEDGADISLDDLVGEDDDDDDVTQEDIDALLKNSDGEDGDGQEDEDILISQDDINTLLMAADQDDDDMLGDMSGEDGAPDLEGLSDDDLDGLVSDSDQVVLEGIEGAQISGGGDANQSSGEKSGKIKALLRSKVVLAAASVLLFMCISVPVSYFLFFSGQTTAPLPEKQTASLTEIDLTREGPGEGYGADALPPSRTSGTILLTDFIILASDQSQSMTYVYTDVSIDYSDQRAYDEINSNLAFYRDLIYGAIRERLVSEKNNEVTEADLLWGVEASLKKVLPPQYIDKISFKAFKAT